MIIVSSRTRLAIVVLLVALLRRRRCTCFSGFRVWDIANQGNGK